MPYVQLPDRPRGLMGRFAWWYSRRRFTAAVDPVRAASRHNGVPLTMGAVEMMAGRGWRRLREPGAFLTTVVTRLCLDVLGSARARRESYVGPWLPEPVLSDDDPETSAELSDSPSLAFLVLLEELTPAERAAFLLRDVFGYGYGDLARIVAKEPAACRQRWPGPAERPPQRPPTCAIPAQSRT